jgi:hypothetical protein
VQAKAPLDFMTLPRQTGGRGMFATDGIASARAK